VGAWLVGIVNYKLLLFVMAGTVLVAAAYLLSRKEQWEKLVPTPEGEVPGPRAGTASPSAAAASVPDPGALHPAGCDPRGRLGLKEASQPN
jgi:hypothetical protein